jgi:hypothetical protein
VARHPSGRVVTPEREAPANEVAAWPRIKEMALAQATNPLMGTELGRLAYFGKILRHELDAGKEWATLVHLHRKLVLGAPLPNPKVAMLEPGIRGGSNAEGELSKEEKRRLRTIQDRYDNAFCCMVELANGVEIMRLVNSICVEDKPLDYGSLLKAKKGLSALAVHFGFIRRKPHEAVRGLRNRV